MVRPDIKGLDVQAAGGLGFLIVVYPLWQDAFGIGTFLKNGSTRVLFCGLCAIALSVAAITWLSLISLPRRVACALGLLGWVLSILAGYQLSLEFADRIK